jgi:hypothetical protein
VSTQTIPDDATPANAAPSKKAWGKDAWNLIVAWVRKEPAAAQSLILAFIALGIAFQWWHWTNGQTGAVVGIVAALLGMFIRSQVTPLAQPRARGRRLVPAQDEPEAATAPPAGQ